MSGYEPDYEQMQRDRDELRAERWLERMDREYGTVEQWRAERSPTPDPDPEPDYTEAPAYQLRCPTCGALPGRVCRRMTDAAVRDPEVWAHPARQRAAGATEA